ncbi:MAG: ABC transporter permease [Candidatus Marinimicrobia bacterium]|nr:ABC transporter permease [Candidatus Neomarinimicrobiota bacterium]
MNFDEGFKLAWQTVISNKLRTFLTTLGIVIGVMSVIGMMSIINALERHMINALSAVGGDIFWVQKYPAVRMGHLPREIRMRKNLNFKHAEAIRKRATYIDAVSGESVTYGKQIKYRDEATNPNILVYGGDEHWADVNGRYISEGRFFTSEEIYRKEYVIILGNDVVEKLFPFSYPMDEYIKIDGIRFKVIGLIEPQGKFLGGSRDNLVAIPYTTFTKAFGQKRSINIAVKARRGQMAEAMDQITGILRVSRKVPPGDPNDFEVITQDSIMDTLKQFTGFIFIAAVVICGISLLVGGIGIMNIMLVAVTERTREIGIRKAVGAKRRHILNQFLTESIGICLIGGLIGVILGVLIGVLIAGALKLPPTIPMWSVFLGVGFSLMIGLIFGVYPAMKAARLDPIEALRYE